MRTMRTNLSLESMKKIDIRAVDPSQLVDIRDVKVNTLLPKEERISDFIEQIKNPYCYKCGKMVVKITFSETQASLEDRLENYLLSL